MSIEIKEDDLVQLYLGGKAQSPDDRAHAVVLCEHKTDRGSSYDLGVITAVEYDGKMQKFSDVLYGVVYPHHMGLFRPSDRTVTADTAAVVSPVGIVPAPAHAPVVVTPGTSKRRRPNCSNCGKCDGKRKRKGVPKPPFVLPANWTTKIKVRTTGRSAGRKDTLYISPSGDQFRSQAAVTKFIATCIDGTSW